jgi:hypothetical protein
LLLGPATRWFSRGAALPFPCHLHDLPVFHPTRVTGRSARESPAGASLRS